MRHKTCFLLIEDVKITGSTVKRDTSISNILTSCYNCSRLLKKHLLPSKKRHFWGELYSLNNAISVKKVFTLNTHFLEKESVKKVMKSPYGAVFCYIVIAVFKNKKHFLFKYTISSGIYCSCYKTTSSLLHYKIEN